MFLIIYLLVVLVLYEYFVNCEEWNFYLENLKYKLKIRLV